ACLRADALLCCATGPATTDSDTLSLHDALPISVSVIGACRSVPPGRSGPGAVPAEHEADADHGDRQDQVQPVVGVVERHEVRARDRKSTRLLQSRENLVCRLLLEKKKIKRTNSR